MKKFQEKIIKKVTGTEMGDFKTLLKERFNQLDRIEHKLDQLLKEQ